MSSHTRRRNPCRYSNYDLPPANAAHLQNTQWAECHHCGAMERSRNDSSTRQLDSVQAIRDMASSLEEDTSHRFRSLDEYLNQSNHCSSAITLYMHLACDCDAQASPHYLSLLTHLPKHSSCLSARHLQLSALYIAPAFLSDCICLHPHITISYLVFHEGLHSLDIDPAVKMRVHSLISVFLLASLSQS